METDPKTQPQEVLTNARRIRFYKEEYQLAARISELVDKELKTNHKLNLCAVRRFCEIMIDY